MTPVMPLKPWSTPKTGLDFFRHFLIFTESLKHFYTVRLFRFIIPNCIEQIVIVCYLDDDHLLAKFGDRSTIMDSGPDVEAPLAVMASSRNPLTKTGSQPEYTIATMRRACTTVQIVVDILRTQVRLYWPVAMSESMANDRHSENTKRVK